MTSDITSPEVTEEEAEFDVSLRPHWLEEFVGQERIKTQLAISLAATKKRNDALGHVLLAGPPGLGKTSLALIMREELGVGIHCVTGPMLDRKADLAAILTALQPRDVLFIDEIHRMKTEVEEILYSAMEDYKLDIVSGSGPTARTITVNLNPFTLIGATTRTGLLTSPLRDRFGMIYRFDYYENEELATIVDRSASLLSVGIDESAAFEIARRSRGTPRIANRVLKWVRDYAEVKDEKSITEKATEKALSLLEIDEYGLERLDREILSTIVDKFNGNPVGLSTLAAVVGEEPNTIEDVYEPYLLKLGFIQRTPRGRVITELGMKHMGYDSKRSSVVGSYLPPTPKEV